MPNGVLNFKDENGEWTYVPMIGLNPEIVAALAQNVNQLNDDLTDSLVSQKGLELFGWIAPKISDDCYDYIEDGVYHKKVGRVDLGSLNWVMTSDGTRFYAITNDLPIKNYTASEKANILCTKYESTPFNGMSALNKVIASYKSGSNVYVSVIDTSYTTKDSFKASVSGVYLYYELSTEITRDINSANVLDTIGTTTNLLNPTLQSQVVNGVTCTNNGDGTYTLNGTATSNTFFAIISSADAISLTAGAKYKFICTKNGSADFNGYIEDGTNVYSRDYRTDSVFTAPNVNIRVTVRINSGKTLVNEIIRPMLTPNLSAQYNDFVQFTGTTGHLNSDVAEIQRVIHGTYSPNNVNSSNTNRCTYSISGNLLLITFFANITTDSVNQAKLLYDFGSIISSANKSIIPEYAFNLGVSQSGDKHFSLQMANDGKLSIIHKDTFSAENAYGEIMIPLK